MTGSQAPAPMDAPNAPSDRTTYHGRRLDASMSLLTELIERPLDPGYAAAAQRRIDKGEAPARSASSVLTITAAGLVGLLLAVAGLQARGQSTQRMDERAQLVQEIQKRDAQANTLQQNNTRLQDQLESARTGLLESQSQGALATRISRLSIATGAVSVTGPGIVVMVNDAESVANPPGGTDPRVNPDADDGRVLDQDLQLVVNGLWAAGAEAVTINGQRLTALSAIRSAGQAILVDYRPLSPPYRIQAIGDPGTLQTRFSDGAGGRNLQYLKDNFGIRASITPARRLTLPASSGIDVRHALPITPTGSGEPSIHNSPTVGGSSTPGGVRKAPPGSNMKEDLP